MQHPRINANRTMLSTPVIAGTRITVVHILHCRGAGDSAEHILQNHPYLVADYIRAAQAYTADYLAHEGIAAVE